MTGSAGMDERYLNQMVGTRLHMGVEPFCLHCGYDMRGTPSGRCPECGAVFERKRWERGVDEILFKVNEADEAAALVPLALAIIVFGVVLRLGTLLLSAPGSVWVLLARLVGAACGVLALLLLTGLKRHLNLPEWAQAKRTIHASPIQVIAAIFLGFVLVASAMVSKF